MNQLYRMMRSGSLLTLLCLPLWLFGQWAAAEQQIDDLFKDQSDQTPGYVVGIFQEVYDFVALFR